MRICTARVALLALLAVSACAKTRDTRPVEAASSASPAPQTPPRTHPQLDGRAFPDHVLALTWDDGPDVGTLKLARYLRSRHISATFFVVREWVAGLSEEPGRGEHVFETGYAHLPVLGDLVALGHRLGNHTKNHVLLAPADPSVVRAQLEENQADIDPFLKNDLRIFRAPGGAWDEAAGHAVDDDLKLEGLSGPIRWDIDGKDWESSLYCRSKHPEIECEPAAPEHASRVRPEVVAKRTVELVEAAGHGIVLSHDRVGHVGSDYPMQVAARLIPELEARGYVFAAPVLAFSAFHPRTEASPAKLAPELRGDLNGDGREDVCTLHYDGVRCALMGPHGLLADSLWAPKSPWLAGTLSLADINGDGRTDLCSRLSGDVACALAP